MPDPSTFALFAAASLAFLAIPGPSVFYIVTRSLTQGRRAGVTSMLGVQAGGLVHVLAAAVGVSALLASSAAAFTVVKYAGAAYLVYLGVKRLLTAGRSEPELEPDDRATATRLFAQGVVVNVLNPKTALFFLAFLPQFVDPDAGPVAPQMLVLGTLLVALGVLSDGTYAVLAAGAGRRLRDAAASRRALDRLSGGVFIGLGLVAALAGEPARR
ncbi:MAG TPA: LysE family translocator [Solirubrobacteraceae bacterium]|jgi:threonine/homoserine/homoserine lactone efflux protein|nr:LysE family translocator [Solirubrobacteraceae bacterium]